MADINTRYGIGYSIDRELIRDAIYLGLGDAKTTYLATGVTADVGVVAPGFDLAKSAEKFADAGWVMGDDGILVAESVVGIDAGTKLELILTTYQTTEAQILAEVIQKMFADVGVAVTIQPVDKPTYDSALEAGEVQIALRKYTWDNADILPWFIHSQYIPTPNYTGVNDTGLDECMDDADYNSATWAERDAKYVICQQHIIDTHYPWAPIFQVPALWFTKDSVTNVSTIPLRAGMSTELWLLIDLDVSD
jgi:ABC-type transport system substrate-binding protein